MNRKYFYTLPLALALAVFSGQSFAHGDHSEKKGGPDPACKRQSDEPVVNLNLKATNNKANPDCALLNLGATVVFSLTPKAGLVRGAVTIEPVNPLDTWLRGSNDHAPDVILITVPGEHDPDKPANERTYTDHHYLVKVDGKTIDPRVEIER